MESLNGLVREFGQFIEQFLDRMEMYQGYADAFAEMSQTQISQVWDSAAAVNMAQYGFLPRLAGGAAEPDKRPDRLRGREAADGYREHLQTPGVDMEGL